MNLPISSAILAGVFLSLSLYVLGDGSDRRRPTLEEPLVGPLPKLIYVAAKDATKPEFQLLVDRSLKDVEIRRGDQVEEPFKRSTLRRDAAFSELMRYPFDLVPRREDTNRLSSRVVVGILIDESGQMTGAWVLHADHEKVAKHVIRKLSKTTPIAARLADRPVPSVLIHEMEYGLR